MVEIDTKTKTAIAVQSAEFDALADVCKAFNDLPAIVDDDYPEMRHVYEGKMRVLVEAITANGRVNNITEIPADPKLTFQKRVNDWVHAAFGSEVAYDIVERSDRFIEEALELVQSCGYDKARVLTLVDYVYGRPPGDPNQEVGGVKMTLAALCNAAKINMDEAAETELKRVWKMIDEIRAKQAAKVHGSALPGPTPDESKPVGDAASNRRSMEELAEHLKYMQGLNANLAHIPEMAKHIADLKTWENLVSATIPVQAITPQETSREAVAQALLDRFIERSKRRRIGGVGSFPDGTKVSSLPASYRDDFFEDADAILSLRATTAGRDAKSDNGEWNEAIEAAAKKADALKQYDPCSEKNYGKAIRSLHRKPNPPSGTTPPGEADASEKTRFLTGWMSDQYDAGVKPPVTVPDVVATNQAPTVTTPVTVIEQAIRWRHKKRGTEYVEIGHGRFQGSVFDDRLVVIYQSADDGKLWVRTAHEFYDGRFERMPDEGETPLWLNGEPYYCRHCGAGGVERDMCEMPNCELETRETAMARQRTHAITTKRPTTLDVDVDKATTQTMQQLDMMLADVAKHFDNARNGLNAVRRVSVKAWGVKQ